MYSSRGGNAYGQQSYTGQSAYGQNLGPAYAGNSAGGPEGGSQVPMVSRHSSMLVGSEEGDGSGYRAHPSAAAHYGGQYSSIYGSAALSSAPQVPPMSTKGSGPSVLESRGGYVPAKPESPKFSSGDYISSSSHGYGHKVDQLYGEKAPDYPAIDRRQFGERQSAYMGRDLQGEPAGRYAESVGFGPQHQSEIYDRIDKAVLLRQEQLLKSQSLQSASLDGSARQADYLAARGAASRHPTQDLTSFGGRMDADPRSLSMLSGSSYGGQPAPSILGAAPRRNDDLMFSQSSSNPGYGVSLPPGRDYATGKGIRGSSLESDYPGSLSHGGHPRIDERKDDRASYLQEFELREEARRRERLRERERDREREKECERERERERERGRILERRVKERDRERKRALETRRERTPPRVSRDRRGSSLSKEGRSLRQDSPHHEALHRRHSPVKDKRREYVCKVYSTRLMDVERDYLSIDKRYPRLFIPSEFCKAVVNWPRENLQLSIHTPVSFEHDFVEEESAAELKERATEMLVEEPEISGRGNIVWNAKIILMSGLSKNALEELSSERGSDDRVSHICNILRFAVLKKDRSCMAIGGRWNPADGGDPSVDDSPLVQTALRYGRDVAKLDLQNCKHWNRFLEIHYDRIGKDGVFSHKEVTVIFVPDLSECLPSLDSWRDQWLAHKKAVAERERQLSLKKERSREKEVLKDKDMESSKHKRVDKEDKKKESSSTGGVKEVKKLEQDGTNMKGNASEGKGDVNDKKIEKKDVSGGDTGRIEDKKEQVQTAEVQTTGTVKTGKKKIIKKVVRQKVVGKVASDTTIKQPDNLGDGGTKGNSETPGQEEESSADPAVVKTFVRKKVIKKVPVEKAAQNEDNIGTKVKVENETGCSEDKSDPSGSTNTSVKTIVKKKIIKRVPKRKATGVELNEGVAKSKKDGDGDEKIVGNETESVRKQTTDAEKSATDIVETEKKVISKPKASKTQVSDRQTDMANSSKADAKDVKEDKKDGKGAGEKSGSVTKVEIEPDTQKIARKDNHNGTKKKLKDDEKTKDEKEKKDRDGKDESRIKSNKELKETRKPEEPPRHPGLILQTKWSKDSKLRSSSLSLDLLLDYTDKDIEESTFELSLFAETLYEKLQYQMGCRLLTFLQKLRIKFVMKRNQRKRQREVEKVEKGNDENSPTKRPKINELPVTNQPAKSSEALSSSLLDGEKQDEEKTVIEENSSVDHVDEVKMEHIADDEEDPEEDPEEYEEMEDASPHPSNENNEEGKSNVIPVPGNEKDEPNVKEQANTKAAETKAKAEADTGERKEGKVDTGKKETPRAKEVVDKELLQAFRFFDRNQVGYIRVEDMRLIVHNLGKFLSHRDVKELVQSALLESNTGRDDHILYKKLVRMTDF